MPTSPSILPPDDPVSLPSMPTLRGGGASRPGEPVLGRIDHYDLLRKLGGGGFGVVYLARDSVSGIEVALKTLHPLLKTNAEEMDVLREKFRLVHGLTHPNIAKALVLHLVRDVNIWDETAHREMRLSPGDSVMVMDYAPGVTLSRWRRQFPDGIVPPDLALEIGRQLASALDYAHGERIVHRDIKPGNIMVETLGPLTGFQDGQDEQDAPGVPQNGGASRPGEPPLVTRHPSLLTSKIRVRLLDFGLAAEIRSSMSRVSTEQGDTSGTRPYMAPEQWLGRKQDGRTDQYALACVLYELLSGAPPFAGVFETGDPAIMANAVVNTAPEEIKDIPAHVNAALMRALAKSPKERFDSCAEFLAAIAGGASSLNEPEQNAANFEADVLRRKAALARLLAEISEEDRKDPEYSALISEVEVEVVGADEAVRLGRFTAATQCLAHAEVILRRFQQIKEERTKEANQAAREKAERKSKVEAEVKRKAREEAERKEQEETERKLRQPGVINLGCGVILEMVPCPDIKPGFWMGKYKVTQEQWKQIMGTNPSDNPYLQGAKKPVTNVSWNDCQEFLMKLNTLPAATASGLTFRLPTVKEWEKARGPIYTGFIQPPFSSHPGLCNMDDGVWEWTQTAVGIFHVFRDGDVDYWAMDRFGRYRCSSDYRYNILGFRLAASSRTATK